MKDIALAIEGGLLISCLWGLLVILVGVVAHHVIRGWKVWRSKRNRVAMGIFALLACYVAGTKPPEFNITWDTGLHNNGSAIDTNELHHISVAWTYDSWIPPRSTFTFSAIPRDAESTNELFVVASVPITDLSFEAYMEREATNYLYFAEHSYIPDVPVVTNGVYHVHCVGGTNIWVPIGLTIRNGATTISPPQTFLLDLITTTEEGDQP